MHWYDGAARQHVGCTRLILARPEDRYHPVPLEDICRDVLDRILADPGRLPLHTLGEVSRLAVLNTYRHRKGESETAVSVTEGDFGRSGPRIRFPFVPVSLCMGAAAIARLFGIGHVFVLTEPRLASHFSRVGFEIRAGCGAMAHRGTRGPSLLSSSKGGVAGLRPLIQPLDAVIKESVDRALRSYPEAQGWM